AARRLCAAPRAHGGWASPGAPGGASVGLRVASAWGSRGAAYAESWGAASSPLPPDDAAQEQDGEWDEDNRGVKDQDLRLVGKHYWRCALRLGADRDEVLVLGQPIDAIDKEVAVAEHLRE